MAQDRPGRAPHCEAGSKDLPSYAGPKTTMLRTQQNWFAPTSSCVSEAWSIDLSRVIIHLFNRIRAFRRAGMLSRSLSSWDHLGSILGPSWVHLGPSWAILGPSWGHLGPSWDHLGTILGPSWAILGPSWAILGPSWDHLGPSWGVFEGSWGVFGGSWGGLGNVLGKSWWVLADLGTKTLNK